MIYIDCTKWIGQRSFSLYDQAMWYVIGGKGVIANITDVTNMILNIYILIREVIFPT